MSLYKHTYEYRYNKKLNMETKCKHKCADNSEIRVICTCAFVKYMVVKKKNEMKNFLNTCLCVRTVCVL